MGRERTYMSWSYAVRQMTESTKAGGGAQPMSAAFAAAGSQRWLQVAVANAPVLLDEALLDVGAIDSDDSVAWKSPLASEKFTEYRDGEVLRCLGIAYLPKRSLSEFWPRRGPVWDALGRSKKGCLILVEAKAHTGGGIAADQSLRSVARPDPSFAGGSTKVLLPAVQG